MRCDVGGNRGTTLCWQLVQFGLKGGKQHLSLGTLRNS